VTSTPADMTVLGEPGRLPLSSLRLDPENPRLPAEQQGADQEELAVTLALGYDPFTVAQSIAAHGFFSAEPLIVIPNDADSDTYVVVEGNRRLTALLGLTRPDIRSEFADAETWDALAAEANVQVDEQVPVVIVKDRATVTPIIGFRHISGILKWQPLARAKYIARLVDNEGRNYTEVAQMTGLQLTEVRDLYRDQAIAVQAGDLGVPTGDLERSFSLLTVAMSSTRLREHVGAPMGSKVVPGVAPVPVQRAGDLREMLGWVFGDGVRPAVIKESREISKLGNVVSHPIGLKALRDGESLVQAVQRVEEASLDPRKRLLKRLGVAKNALLHASEDIADFGTDEDVGDALEAVQEALHGLVVVQEES
jgi:hypothetical protein